MGKEIPVKLLNETAPSHYASERKIYPRAVSGRFDRLRKAAVVWLLGMYYGVAWLRMDDRQAVLFDLPARKFHVFALTFWPQDFPFLALLLIILALSLFFFTALAGRLWCGYACPQTVWTEIFLWIESWTEGDRSQRMKLDVAPWTWNKLRRKGAKHALWLMLGLWTGFTFVGYFTPIADLGARLGSLAWNGTETFWVLFYGFATWGNAGFLREQVCKYMCPYARFQSAMFDRNTLIIAYDPMRGEPRGPRQRGLASVLERVRGLLPLAAAYDYVFRASAHPSAAAARIQAGGTITFAHANVIAEALPKFALEDLGDCIDCTLCVQVCPVGIDIRNGLQYECIACGACIDACDQVMAKVGYPKGLIRYATQESIEGRPSSVVRPRIIIYAVLLLALAGVWIYGVVQRTELIAEVLRDRNTLYRLTAEGIGNGYTLKLINKSARAQQYRISLQTRTPQIVLSNAQIVNASAEQIFAVPLELNAPATLRGRHEVRFVIESVDGKIRESVDSSFFGPGP